jgi:uncharacterized membrane protein
MSPADPALPLGTKISNPVQPLRKPRNRWTIQNGTRSNDMGHKRGFLMATVAQVYEDRKMSMGRVFERAFATILHNPLVTLGLALLFGGAPSLLSTYATNLVRADMTRAQSTGGSFSTFGYEMIGLTLFSWALGILIAALTQAVLTRATTAESDGRKARFGECISAAFRVVLPLAALMILLVLAVMLGFVLLIVPGVILYVMWSVASPALVEEHSGVFGSFRRSQDLTKGARWKIFGLLLIVLVVAWVLEGAAALAALQMVGLNGMKALGSGQLPLAYTAVMLVVSTLTNVFWGTVQASTYVELRQWKEGGSTEQLAEVFA